MELGVLILDDEEIILDGLCHFPWKDYGCTVVAKAEDGEKGLALMTVHKPYIILSDIKMPEMNGLEFARRAKEICPEVEIILLTGYDEFEFAKSAIHIGVSEYLLKPVNFKEMHTAVGKVCCKIRSTRKVQRDYAELQRKYQKTIPAVRRKVISDLIYGRFNDSKEMQKRLENLNIYIEQYVLVYGSIHADEGKERAGLEPNLFDFVVENICEEFLKQTGQQVYYEFDNLGYCFIVTFPRHMAEKDCEVCCEQACEKIQKNIREVLQVEMAFGISRQEKNLFRMNHAYEQALEACEQGAYLGEGSGILTYADVADIKLPVWRVSDGEKKRLLSELMQGNIETAKKLIQEIFEQCPDIETMRYNVMEVMLLSVQYLADRRIVEHTDKENSIFITECLKKVYESHTKQAVLSVLKSIVEYLAERNRDERLSRNQKSAKSMMEYIEENYGEDLSLDTLADHFKLSKTYINRLLKNYSGKSFLEILLKCRMEKAEDLIAQGEHKIYEIAEMVGYHDQSYFIRVFKKYYGVTPNVYKRI